MVDSRAFEGEHCRWPQLQKASSKSSGIFIVKLEHLAAVAGQAVYDKLYTQVTSMCVSVCR